MSDHLNQGLKPVITETAITAGTYQIFGKFNHNRNYNFYLQFTVTITINSLQKRVIIGNKKQCKKTKCFQRGNTAYAKMCSVCRICSEE